jgi:hypothetical protein
VKHLRADEVYYSGRPRTLFEEQIWTHLQTMSPQHPAFYPAWGTFLWSRSDKVYPQTLFNDILMTDFDGHRHSCIEAMVEAHALRRSTDALDRLWDTPFDEKPWKSVDLSTWSVLENEC